MQIFKLNKSIASQLGSYAQCCVPQRRALVLIKTKDGIYLKLAPRRWRGVFASNSHLPIFKWAWVLTVRNKGKKENRGRIFYPLCHLQLICFFLWKGKLLQPPGSACSITSSGPGRRRCRTCAQRRKLTEAAFL